MKNKWFAIEKSPRKGLMPMEWVMMAYLLATSVMIMVTFTSLPHPWQMFWTRAQALLATLALWGVYRLMPCRVTTLFRVVGQLILLGIWYPDTYELNRVFHNLDHVFAGYEQMIFGCQPALVFSEACPWPVFSELLTLGYVSYYFLFMGIALFYFLWRYEQFERATFIILGSFFLFYVIFVFLPVAGPQFYYKAAGVENIAAGIFPDLKDYFGKLAFDVHDPQYSLPIPGYADGFFYHILEFAHDAGERPTAAFPSSHVGVTTVVAWLAWESRNRLLFWVVTILGILMFFATFYIQAHYAIDAIAGVFAGTLMYFILRFAYNRFIH